MRHFVELGVERARPSRMVTTVTGSLLRATAPIAAASLRPTQM